MSAVPIPLTTSGISESQKVRKVGSKLSQIGMPCTGTWRKKLDLADNDDSDDDDNSGFQWVSMGFNGILMGF